MIDYEDLIRRLEKNVEALQNGPCVSLKTAREEFSEAANAIKELVAERGNLRIDLNLMRHERMAWLHRAEKAETDLTQATAEWRMWEAAAADLSHGKRLVEAELAAERAALEQDCTGCVHAPECEGETYDEECMNCRRFYGDGYAIAAVEAEAAPEAPAEANSCHTCGRVVDGSCGIEDACSAGRYWQPKPTEADVCSTRNGSGEHTQANSGWVCSDCNGTGLHELLNMYEDCPKCGGKTEKK